MSDIIDAFARLPLPPETTAHHCRTIAASTLKMFAANLNKAVDDAVSDADQKSAIIVRKYLQMAMHNAIKTTMAGVAKDSTRVNNECSVSVGEEIKKIVALVEVDRLRSNYFGRIAVRQIENCFPLRQDIFLNLRIREEHVRGIVPRQIVGGLLQSLKTVYGADFLTEKEELCANIVKKYQTNIRVTDWYAVFADDSAKAMARQIFNDSLKEKLSGKSRDWFIGVIKDNKTYREIRRGFNEDDYQGLMRALFINHEDIRNAKKAASAHLAAISSTDPEVVSAGAKGMNEAMDGLAKDKRDLFILQLIHHKIVDAGPLCAALALRYSASGDKWGALKEEMDWVAQELLARAKWYKQLPDNKNDLVQTAYFRNKDEASRQYVQARTALSALNCPKELIP